MKKKIVKKLIAAAMATSMVASFAACGGEDAGTDTPGTNAGGNDPVESGDTNTGDDTTPSSEAEEDLGAYTLRTDENGNTYDLGGMEIIIRDWWSGDPAEPTDDYEEARDEYREWIQETYNFTIKEQAISSWSSTPEDFANYATTGGDENYIFVLRQGTELTAAMNQGLMYDVASLGVFDFSEEKWGSRVHEMYGKGSSVYGFRGIKPEARGGLFFNKRILEEANINPDDLYTWQENMEWTWEKFEEVLEAVQADTDNDGVIDRHAMVCVTQDFFPLAVYSNGGQYIGKDENGKYYNNLESAETIEALNWSIEIIDKYNKVFASDAAWDYAYTAFMNGEGAFMPQEAYKAGDIKDMEDDYGFVAFPMGPKMDDYTNCYVDNVMAIPACYDADKAWKIAFAYDLYTEPIPGYEDVDGSLSGYYQKFRDLESVDLTIKRLNNKGMVTYHTFIPNLSMGSDLYWKINKDNTPAQQAEAIRNTWQSYIDEANK